MEPDKREKNEVLKGPDTKKIGEGSYRNRSGVARHRKEGRGRSHDRLTITPMQRRERTTSAT